MSRIRALATKVAPSSISVLILGESGVGKDVLARTIHDSSPRAKKPFMAINCAAISESLMAVELFGHGRGAFTGAVSGGKTGLLEAAQDGTVFLDEIGDMPPPMQAALLRAIDTREVRPIMGTSPRTLNVRFLAATNRNLRRAVATGRFRADLLHRLNTVTLRVPPLRERRQEIPALALTFVEAACRDGGQATPVIGPDVMTWLLRHDWPGNIRELRNHMFRAVALSEGPELRLEHLLLEDPSSEDLMDAFDSGWGSPEDVNVGGDEVRRDPHEAERAQIVAALQATHGNQTRAALLLGMSRRTFISRLDRHRLPRPQKGTPRREGTRPSKSSGRSGAMITREPSVAILAA